MDLSGLTTFVRERPVLAGSAAAVSAGLVGLVWWRGRGSSPATAQYGPSIIDGTPDGSGRVVSVTNVMQQPVTTPAPMPTPKPTGDSQAPMPKGFMCPSGGRPVYERKAGSFVQTTGNVVCMFADRRIVPLVKAK